jgi:hypothetical protein
LNFIRLVLPTPQLGRIELQSQSAAITVRSNHSQQRISYRLVVGDGDSHSQVSTEQPSTGGTINARLQEYRARVHFTQVVIAVKRVLKIGIS